MAIMCRCSNTKCRAFYSYSHKICPKCGGKDRKLYISYREGGKLKFRAAGDTLSEAKTVSAEIQLEKKESGTKKIMLMNFVETVFIPYFNAKNKNGNERWNEQYITNITKNFPNIWLGDITPMDIETYLISVIDRGCAIATRNNHLAMLRGMFNYAVKMEYISKSPVKSAKIKVDNARKRYLLPDEKDRLLNACKESKTPYLYPMVMVALHTGMRKEAVKNFKKSWIVNDIIQVPPQFSKSKDAYHIPLTAQLKELLNTLDEFDFNHDIKKSFAVAKKKAGIKNFTFHDLRHTFGSELAQAGVSEYTISKLLGHTDTAMAKRYSHLSPNSILNAIHKLDEKPVTKKCPDCAELIKIDARKCRFCGYIFDAESD